TDPVCPAQLGAGGIFGNLMNANGTQTSTPEPAVSADATSGGYVVGSADVGTGSASFLTLFKVTKNAQGYASISAPTPITVVPYVRFAGGAAVPNGCRWGDWGGAPPDPLRAMGGQLWLSGEWNNPMTDGTTPTWQTWNWPATP